MNSYCKMLHISGQPATTQISTCIASLQCYKQGIRELSNTMAIAYSGTSTLWWSSKNDNAHFFSKWNRNPAFSFFQFRWPYLVPLRRSKSEIREAHTHTKVECLPPPPPGLYLIWWSSKYGCTICFKWNRTLGWNSFISCAYMDKLWNLWISFTGNFAFGGKSKQFWGEIYH